MNLDLGRIEALRLSLDDHSLGEHIEREEPSLLDEKAGGGTTGDIHGDAEIEKPADLAQKNENTTPNLVGGESFRKRRLIEPQGEEEDL